MHQHSNPDSLLSRDSGFSGSGSYQSDKSYHSYDTTPTDYSSSTRPPFVHHDTCDGRLEYQHHTYPTKCEPQYHALENPRLSTETYASTVDFEDDVVEDDEPERPLPPNRPLQSYPSDSLPATPADFAELFPSSRELSIKHDDSTDDGNMNLRIDTTVHLPGGRKQDVTLFHLRMHDLKKREFSLRRYCRDSGREICHSVRKYQKPAAERRPSLGRSFSSAFAAMRSKSETKTAPTSSLKRSDSGYASVFSRQSIDVQRDTQEPASEATPNSSRRPPIPTNTTKLEFSNYSQVEVKRRGTKSSKRYEFEYWGTVYTWKRVVERTGSSTTVMYCLYRPDDSQILARIEPRSLSGAQAYDERSKGGWVPPCIMRIDDKRILQAQNETSE